MCCKRNGVENVENESQMKSWDITNILQLAVVENHSDWQVADTEGDSKGAAVAGSTVETRQNSAKLSSNSIFISVISPPLSCKICYQWLTLR